MNWARFFGFLGVVFGAFGVTAFLIWFFEKLGDWVVPVVVLILMIMIVVFATAYAMS